MVRVNAFNATFNNISIISWRSVLLDWEYGHGDVGVDQRIGGGGGVTSFKNQRDTEEETSFQNC